MWRLLGYILAGLFAASVTAYVVKGIIDKHKLKQAMRDNDFQEAVVDTVNRYARKVKLKDIKRDRYLEVEGDEIASDIHEGDRIYA